MAASPDIAPRIARGAVQSFEDNYEERVERRSEAKRLRLTSEEARYIRYVLSEWDGECGAGSSMGAQLEKLAQKPEHAPADREFRRKSAAWFQRNPSVERWRVAWAADAQTMYVPSPSVSIRDREWPQDAYLTKRRDERDAILRAWHALRSMAKGLSVVVLVRLYGDCPPGLPIRGLWPKDTDHEYRRVCRYAKHGGPTYELEDALGVDRSRRVGETSEAHKARVAAGVDARAARIRVIGDECERLIVAAAHDYRAAWRATSDRDTVQRGGTGSMRTVVVREEVPVGLMGPISP